MSSLRSSAFLRSSEVPEPERSLCPAVTARLTDERFERRITHTINNLHSLISRFKTFCIFPPLHLKAQLLDLPIPSSISFYVVWISWHSTSYLSWRHIGLSIPSRHPIPPQRHSVVMRISSLNSSGFCIPFSRS